MWVVVILDEAAEELQKIPAKERAAFVHVLDKLEAMGPRLGYPHSSAVQGVTGDLRELRPRAGRSPWRGLYRRVGDEFVVAAIAPEAQHDQRGFKRACRLALERLTGAEGD